MSAPINLNFYHPTRELIWLLQYKDHLKKKFIINLKECLELYCLRQKFPKIILNEFINDVINIFGQIDFDILYENYGDNYSEILV